MLLSYEDRRSTYLNEFEERRLVREIGAMYAISSDTGRRHALRLKIKLQNDI